MKPLQLCAFLSFLLILGCAPKAAEQSSDNTTVDSVAADTLVTEGDSPDDEAPKSPDPKPEGELKALAKAEEAIKKAEQEYLGNARLTKLVAALKDSEDEDGMPVYGKLAKQDFAQLTAKGLLYYVVFHPESWDQICAESAFEAGKVKAISPYLPFRGDYASERQAAALKLKADSIEILVLDCVNKNHGASEQMLRMVAEQDLTSAIVPLIEAYKSQSPQNDLILSTFIEMMDNGQFETWTNSETAKAANDVFGNWLSLTPENADKVIFYAKKYATK